MQGVGAKGEEAGAPQQGGLVRGVTAVSGREWGGECSFKKEPAFWGEKMPDFKGQTGQVQGEPGASCAKKIRECLKKKKQKTLMGT